MAKKAPASFQRRLLGKMLPVKKESLFHLATERLAHLAELARLQTGNPTRIGGVAEVLGLISTGLLAYLLRKRRTAFILTVGAAVSFAGMLALFAFGNNPRPCLPIGARYAMRGTASTQPVPSWQLWH